MTTVYHPDLVDVTYDVPESDVDDWTAAGWRKTPPAAAESSKSKTNESNGGTRA